MNYEYVDQSEYDISVEKVNEVIKETDWDAFQTWYQEQKLPKGSQCIQLHAFPSMGEYVNQLMEERNLDTSDNILRLKIALLIDSMIH